MHDCTAAERVASTRIAPLAPGPLRDEFEELAGRHESDGIERSDAEFLAAEQLGLLVQ